MVPGAGSFHPDIFLLFPSLEGDTMDKPTFIRLRERHHFDTPLLADRSDVDSKTIYNLLMRVPVERLQAEKVLKTLSKLTGHTYTVENVDIVLKD
jgi:hypothetical protein